MYDPVSTIFIVHSRQTIQCELSFVNTLAQNVHVHIYTGLFGISGFYHQLPARYACHSATLFVFVFAGNVFNWNTHKTTSKSRCLSWKLNFGHVCLNSDRSFVNAIIIIIILLLFSHEIMKRIHFTRRRFSLSCKHIYFIESNVGQINIDRDLFKISNIYEKQSKQSHR